MGDEFARPLGNCGLNSNWQSKINFCATLRARHIVRNGCLFEFPFSTTVISLMKVKLGMSRDVCREKNVSFPKVGHEYWILTPTTIHIVKSTYNVHDCIVIAIKEHISLCNVFNSLQVYFRFKVANLCIQKAAEVVFCFELYRVKALTYQICNPFKRQIGWLDLALRNSQRAKLTRFTLLLVLQQAMLPKKWSCLIKW